MISGESVGEQMKRRQFLKSALAGSAILLSHRASHGATSRQSRSADSRIEVLLNEPIGRINPEIYGHFAEHLGGVVYGGILGGEESKKPHGGGGTQAPVHALERIKPSGVPRAGGGLSGRQQRRRWICRRD